jgi:hypothetical protein
MQLYIKQINGNIITVEVEPTDLVHSIKKQIFDLKQIPISQQRLIYCGKEVNDNEYIEYYQFQCEGAINLIITPL